jgi:hypothetical protein
MGTLMAFVLGYVIGGQGKSRELDDAVVSLGAIRESDDFGAFVMVARSQISRTLREVADMVDDPKPDTSGTPDLVDRVKQLVERG